MRTKVTVTTISDPSDQYFQTHIKYIVRTSLLSKIKQNKQIFKWKQV